MNPLSLDQKRVIAGAYLVIFLFALGNHYLGWGVIGRAAKPFLAVVQFLGLLGMVRYGPEMLEEVRARKARLRESEDAAERERDKSNDATETDRLRRGIGRPASKSLDRTREK